MGLALVGNLVGMNVSVMYNTLALYVESENIMENKRKALALNK